MLVRKAYKFKLKPTEEIAERFSQMAGCCRFLWNKGLQLNLARLERQEPMMWYQELAFWLTLWKKSEEFGFLKGCHSQALQQVLKRLERAFKDGFDERQPLKRLPTFKRKGRHNSFCYPLFKPKNSFRKYEKQLAKEQRRLARKIRFSNGWKRQKRRIARVHQRIRDCRHDFLHWISSKISKNHAMIVVEALNVAKMSASTKGSVKKPGRHVKAKSGLNKSILDQGWGLFKEMLRYKLCWLGGRLLFVDPKYTSQKCPHCGIVDAKNRLNQADFCCLQCGYSNHADVVGAKNILAAGLAVLACQANRVSGWQQEPVGHREVGLPSIA